MDDERVYERLAAALDRMPGPFPVTESHAERPLLRKLFRPEQARVAAVMGHEPSSVTDIADRASVDSGEAAALLAEMAAAGLVAEIPAASGTAGYGGSYRLQSFLPGIFENQVGSMDEELARLFEDYMADGGAAVVMGAHPPHARIAPTAAARTEWVLPHDDAQAIIEQAGSIVVEDCVCRVQRDKVGARCRFPLHVCLNLSEDPRPDAPGLLSTEEALAVLDEAEEAGLVHTVSNVAGRWDWICNCCSCCCEFLRAYTEWDVDGAVVRNYRAVVDEGRCTTCGACEERCQISAVTVADGVAVVDTRRCLGCGLCVTTCTADAVHLERLPAAELVEPPADPTTWEQERLRSRDAE